MLNRWVWQDLALRALIIVSGLIAAILFVRQGNAEVLPALAIGGVLGACLIRKSVDEKS